MTESENRPERSREEILAEFLEQIKRTQEQLFAGRLKSDDYLKAEAGAQHTYFSPYWHARHGLVTPELLEDLKTKDQSILSVGSGPALLEKTLVELGINPEVITISDLDETSLPTDFKSEVFDMHQAWPDSIGQYSVIIFPESIRVNTQANRGEAFYNILKNSLNHLAPGGQIRMDGYSLPSKTVEQVIDRLKQEGFEIQTEQTKELLVINLEQEN
jgi:hypothetical protein